ncbi:MAG: HD domain-containing phosphohydrolase [Tepidisphaeraceae bacterium]|jgi:putative two-component system response regulator
MPVLIVDDNPMALLVLKNALIQGGYEVTATNNADDALAVLRVSAHRLVITDREMPGMDGLQLCRAIRSEGLAGYTYIIMLTARSEADERVEGLSAGADDLIAKPFHPAELLVRVRNAERLLALETRDVASFALAKLAESRDLETGTHLERVRNYCRVLAQHLASQAPAGSLINSEYVRLIYQTSPLHDIGKVGIPDVVLLKPGKLTEREFEIMKTHTIIGARTLEAAIKQFPGIDFLEMARDIAMTHHERWDGSGYPNQLAGEQIPLCGRIMAVADVYDALTTKRVYKPAYEHEFARSTIVGESGRQFDPAVVEAFIQTESTFIALRNKLSEAASAAA